MSDIPELKYTIYGSDRDNNLKEYLEKGGSTTVIIPHVIPSCSHTLLETVMKSWDYEQIKQILSAPNLNTDYNDNDEYSVLHDIVSEVRVDHYQWITKDEWCDLLHILLNRPDVNPNQKDIWGFTPFMQALIRTNWTYVDLMLQYKHVDTSLHGLESYIVDKLISTIDSFFAECDTTIDTNDILKCVKWITERHEVKLTKEQSEELSTAKYWVDRRSH